MFEKFMRAITSIGCECKTHDPSFLDHVRRNHHVRK